MKPHKLTPAGSPSSSDGRWRHNRPAPLPIDAELEQQAQAAENAARAADRRRLFETDPLWRLSKLKDNRERRLRAKRAAEVQAFLEAWIARRRLELDAAEERRRRELLPPEERRLEALCGRAWAANRRRIRARAAAGNFSVAARAPIARLSEAR